MTPRDRFLRSLNGGPVDRLFRYEHGAWPTTLELWRTQGLPPEVGRSVSFADHFDMDPVNRIMINSGYTDSPFYPPFDREELSEDSDTRVFIDSDGIVKKLLKRNEDTSMPQFLRFPVENREDWLRVSQRLKPEQAPERIGDPARLIAHDRHDVASMLPICGAFGHPRNLLGEVGLAYALYDDPDLIEEILDNWLELYVVLLEKLTGIVRVDCLLVWEDMCFKGGPLIDPRQFRKFMSPRYCELIETARRCGVESVLVDTDGNCHEMIPVFLDAGADALMPFEVQAGMDVVDVRRRYGPCLGIMGGIDKRTLAEGEEAIRRELDRVVPPMLESGGFLPTLDHTVPTNVTLEAFERYLSILRTYE